MGEISSNNLRSIVNVDKYYYDKSRRNGHSDPEGFRKVNTSLAFFHKFQKDYEWTSGVRGGFGGGMTEMVEALSRRGWNDDIIYGSIVENMQVFMKRNGISSALVEKVAEDRLVELYDFVVDRLKVYLKVDR